MVNNQLKHLAIIMDGNGRWAKKRGLKRVDGHKKGAEVVKEITTYCANNPEISILTLARTIIKLTKSNSKIEFIKKVSDDPQKTPPSICHSICTAILCQGNTKVYVLLVADSSRNLEDILFQRLIKSDNKT